MSIFSWKKTYLPSDAELHIKSVQILFCTINLQFSIVVKVNGCFSLFDVKLFTRKVIQWVGCIKYSFFV